MGTRRTPLLTSLLVLCLGCSSAGTQALSPADQERMEYEKAATKLLNGKSFDASEELTRLMENSSNPEVTELAHLRLGEALFAEGKYAEAREVFRQYIEQYGSSRNVPHALYMSARCHYERAPEDMWVLPPVEEREQTNVSQAVTLLRRLIIDYPGSFAAAKGRVLFATCARRQCEHDLYVADYYKGRDRPSGTIQRLEQLLTREGGQRKLGLLPSDWVMCGHGGEGFTTLAEAYAAEGNLMGVQRTMDRYLEIFPRGPELQELEEILARAQAGND